METNPPSLGSLRSQSDRRDAEAYLDRGAALGESLDALARWLDGLRRVFAPRPPIAHR